MPIFEHGSYCHNNLHVDQRERPSVLVMAYSRNSLVKELLEMIPPNRKLYIHLDGPTSTNALAISQTKSVIEAFIKSRENNSSQEILLRINKENLGPKLAFSNAISWAFNTTSELIVLEEDVRFNYQFFEYMDWCLSVFRDNPRIGQINGFSPLNLPFLRNRIFESQNSYCWGWATWRDRWGENDIDIASKISSFADLSAVRGFKIGKGYLNLWEDRLDRLRSGFDTWDFQWNLSTLSHGRFAITPAVSLVTNVGFGLNATNTKVPKRYVRKLEALTSGKIVFKSLKVLAFPSIFNTYSDLIQFKTISFTPKGLGIIQSIYSFALKIRIWMKRL